MKLLASLALAGSAALVLLLIMGVASVSAQPGRSRDLHVLKDCSAYTGAAGSYCTIAFSNVPEIKVGSKVFYDQTAGTPAGLLDSNVVLDAGSGNRAVGRCTLDFGTGLGLCTLRSELVEVLRFQAHDCFSNSLSDV